MRAMPSADTKGNGQSNLNHDEGSLDPETDEENTVVRAIEDSQTEVFNADKDSADQVCDTILLAGFLQRCCVGQLTGTWPKTLRADASGLQYRKLTAESVPQHLQWRRI
jgi:hypothetical protein